MEASSIRAFTRGIKILHGLHPGSDFWKSETTGHQGNGSKLIFVVFTDFSPNIKSEPVK